MARAVRELLTQDVLSADREFCDVAGDVRGRARVRAEMRLLAELPDGFEIERTSFKNGCGPRGFELALFDVRGRPRRRLAAAHRRYIGRPLVSWQSGPGLVDPDAADAFSVILRLAAS